MKTLRLLLTAAFLFLGVAVSHATDIFVDNSSGCPGSGTTGSPYCALSSAITNAAPGHDIKIRTGSSAYTGTYSAPLSGTAGNPIIVEADAGNNPTMQIRLN